MPEIPAPDLHTPDELLSNASDMFATGDPKLFRGAILESMVALEAYVQRTVFRSLARRLGSALAKWLEEKTRMDFDSRLSVLTPVATGLPIDKSSALWGGYKKAKGIRNEVVHSGQMVSARDVELVMTTVREWLAYLGTYVELESVLLALKHWVETSRTLAIGNDEEATLLVSQYFDQTNAVIAAVDVDVIQGRQGRRADLILDFGPRKVLVETKFFNGNDGVRDVILNAVNQADTLRKAEKIDQACVIVFIRKQQGVHSANVERHNGGAIFSIAIEVRQMTD